MFKEGCINRACLPHAGDVWHIAVEGLPGQGVLYGYKISGPGNRFNSSTVMLDPYAPLVEGRKEFGKRDSIEDFKQEVSVATNPFSV